MTFAQLFSGVSTLRHCCFSLSQSNGTVSMGGGALPAINYSTTQYIFRENFFFKETTLNTNDRFRSLALIMCGLQRDDEQSRAHTSIFRPPTTRVSQKLEILTGILTSDMTLESSNVAGTGGGSDAAGCWTARWREHGLHMSVLRCHNVCFFCCASTLSQLAP